MDSLELTPSQEAYVLQMLHEKRNAFAPDDPDLGCIEDLQMNIPLTDDVPVNRTYMSIPRPLYAEVKEYLHDLIDRGWIKKSDTADTPYTRCLGRTWRKYLVHDPRLRQSL